MKTAVKLNMNSILIGTDDRKRLQDYYTKLFGKPTYEDDGYVGWQLGNGSISIGAHDQVKGKNSAPGRIIWNLESPDVKAQFAELKAAGATVVREPHSLGEFDGKEMWIATLSDPDDNY